MGHAMKVSHLHLSFTDFPAAKKWFKQILGLSPVHEEDGSALYELGDIGLALHPDWGEGDTAMTLALKSSDCTADYENALSNGADPRTPPRDKGDTIGADVYGPGRLVIEWEQLKAPSA